MIEPTSGFSFSHRLSISALKANPIDRHGHRQNVTDRFPRRTTGAMLHTFKDCLNQSRNVNSASVQNQSIKEDPFALHLEASEKRNITWCDIGTIRRMG
jgi:hypothetical protein